jgi:two-component system response regulator MprA
MADDRRMNQRVLIVDDDLQVRKMLMRSIAAEGFDVVGATDGGSALAAVEQSAPDYVVLDVTMPGIDGLSVCRRLRSKGVSSSIIMLTARDTVSDRVLGLEAGADDYLVKPFAIEELVARIRALGRRGHRESELLTFADLTLDLTLRLARRRHREVTLSQREAALLELLIRRAPHVVARDIAIEQIWGDAAVDNVVDQYVTRLRRKLGDPPLIHSVRGVGFMLRR